MNRAIQLSLVLGLACCAAASAQSSRNSVNLHHLYLPMDGGGFYTVDDAHTLKQGEFAVSANFSHGHKVLELGIPGDRRVLRLIRQMSVVDVSASVGLLDGLSLGIGVPYLVDYDGRELNNLASDVRGEGFGAARIQLKGTLFERRHDLYDFAIALRPYVTLPTGRPRDYLSDNERPTFGTNFIAELTFIKRFRAGIEIGWEGISSDADVGDLEIEGRIRFGGAFEVILLRADEDELDPLPQSRWFGSPAWKVASHHSWRGEQVSPSGLARTYDAMVFLASAYGKDELHPRERALLQAARENFELSAEAAQARERRVAATDPEDLDLAAADANERRFLFEGVAEMASCDGEVSWDEKLALRRVAHANGVSVAMLRRAVESARAEGSTARAPDAWFGLGANQRPLRVETLATPEQLAPGEEADVVVTVINTGDALVHDVEVEGELPSGFSVLTRTIGADGYRDESGPDRIRFVGGTLGPGESVEVRLRVVAGETSASARYTPAAYGVTDPPPAFGHTLALGGEVFGWTNTSRPFHNERERPIEAGGYLRYSHSCGFFFRAGLSVALNNGIGAPDVRYLVGSGFRF